MHDGSPGSEKCNTLKRGVAPVQDFFFVFLMPLLGGSLPLLMNLPGLLLRFTGIETTALASAGGPCNDGEDGHVFTFTFTDSHEKVYHIPDTDCSSGIVADGERVMLWYQPDNPSHLIAANYLHFCFFFLALFSLLFLITFAFVDFLSSFLSRRRRNSRGRPDGGALKVEAARRADDLTNNL